MAIGIFFADFCKKCLTAGTTLFRFRAQCEVAGIRDNGELCITNDPKYFKRVLNPNKIMISHGNQSRRLDGD